MSKDIERALSSLQQNQIQSDKARRYHEGKHDLAFATEKFRNTFGGLFREFALNLCPIISDAVRDKLRINGFSVDSSSAGTDRTTEAARNIWSANRMDIRAGEVHKETLISGNAYIFVWPDVNGRPRIYPHPAANVAVRYDDEDRFSVKWAVKSWTNADGRMRLSVYYPDRTERYVARKNSAAFPPPDDLDLIEDADAIVANPYGVVPVFHFANNADVGNTGRSEIEPAMPIQDGLNKAVLDMLVAMEFSAFRQRWAAGIEIQFDADGKAVGPFEGSVDHLWIAGDPQARFGDFEAAQLDQFLRVKDSFRLDMASVTGTPLHYFLQNDAGLPSGEALRRSEARFLAKVRDRQQNFGQVWADAMSFAVRIAGLAETRLVTLWEDPAPVSEREILENLLLKRRIGLPAEKALLEAGYGNADVGRNVSRQG